MTSDADLDARFASVFAEIEAGAVERERERRMPVREIGLLRDAGWGLLRVPESHGGLGATMTQTVRQMIALGTADSNLPQALRGHLAFVEGRRRTAAAASRDEWFRLITTGVLVGNSQAERGATTGTTAELRPDGDGYRLTGRKYYSTGTIFSDWTITSATLDGDHVSVLVELGGPGVEALDDWDGFGQRMTGSGTTVFDEVPVRPEHVLRLGDEEAVAHASVTGLFQTVLLSALAGIARAVLRDAVAFVRPRTRTFGIPGASSPREDPLVQALVGRLTSTAFAVESIVLAVAERFDALDNALAAGDDDPELHTAAQLAAFRAQQVVLPLVLAAATELFEVGGASATGVDAALDRHWRNARTLASHNPAIHRAQQLGDYELNGVVPMAGWVRELLERRAAR
ncbi:acyl-CoA dehydrogenase family protein [Pseudolysinimonas kribbensis]|uniref:acyl-CoA dehydrogenase family protein n=1 Tax=Pseudolysinimonas kribbensis TaxID=433641 RepID=UPI0031D22F5A